MTDSLTEYKRGDQPIAGPNELWPLYGAGLENLGVDGQPIDVPMPPYGPDELLVRHDACGLCFSDIKVINLGQKHPRIFRDISKDPVVLGHEVSLTVVGVGENLRDQYQVGDRFIVQADICVKGVNYAYGYMIQGGLSQYGVIDQRILNGDDGNYLIPVQAEHRLRRERADRAVGLRHRGLRAALPHRAQGRRDDLDHRGRRPRSGIRDGELHH